MDQTDIDALFESQETEEKPEAVTPKSAAVDRSPLEEKVAKKLESVAAKKATPAEVSGKETKVVETGERHKGIETGNRGEVSVSTLARMMGVATTSELALLEGKIDLLATRVSGLTVRMDKVLNAISGVPTGADLDRIDINIGSLKTMIREALETLSPPVETGPALDGSKIKSSAKEESDASEDE